MKRSAIITGVGMYVPKKVITNEELEQMLDRPGTADWLVKNVGIRERRVMAKDENTSDLATYAAREALENAGLNAKDLDLIILSTDTPDCLSPATSVIVQHKLGAINAGTFDVNAACAGLVTALDIGSRYIETDPQINNVMVIGAYGMTRFVDWTDHYTCTLFSDGAGALLLSASENKEGFLASQLSADGSFYDHLGIFVGGTAEPCFGNNCGKQFVQFRKRFPPETNLKNWPIVTRKALAKINMTPEECDWFFFTQVNERTIRMVMEELGVPLSKTHTVMHKWGYTGSACVPLVIYDAIKKEKLPPPGQGNGEVIALCTSGGGANFSAGILKWW
ncbi:MAG: 3-oxoacyl-ACP synthase III family protein [Candidatus Hodarchaeales archaeon]